MTTWIDTEKYLTKSNTLLSLKKKKTQKTVELPQSDEGQVWKTYS